MPCRHYRGASRYRGDYNGCMSGRKMFGPFGKATPYKPHSARTKAKMRRAARKRIRERAAKHSAGSASPKNARDGA